MKMAAATDVEHYIAQFPESTQLHLKQLRQAILKAAPNAIESISYQMPAYKLHGPLVYFGAYQKHIGFYPGVEAITVFQKEVSAFKNSKGTIQFPLHRPIPTDLVTKIVTFRIAENLEKFELKAKNKK